MNMSASLKIMVASVVAFAGIAVQAATVTVFAAASLTDSLKEIGRDYQNRTGQNIEFNFASSGILERQIEEGAPADIFFSADEAKMDALEKKGLLEKRTRRPRLSNSLVIVVPKDSALPIKSPQDLALKQVTFIALGDTKTVPAGIYAKEYLQKIHLWDEIAPKVTPMENVRAALVAVEDGNAEAGIVYKTDAAISKKIRIAYEVPRGEAPAISYPVAAIKASKNLRATIAFLSYLNSEAAGQVFSKYGFIVETHQHDGH